MAGLNWGDPGKNDFKIEAETGEPPSELTGTQSSRKAKANDGSGKQPSLQDQMMQTGRRY